MTSQKRVLVTGATGFIGSNLVRRLISLNFEVHITARNTSNFWRIQDHLSTIKTHHVDMLEKKALEKLLRKIKPHGIFHLANLGVYGGAENPPEEYIDTNFLGTVNLLEAAQEIDYEFLINSGSSAEYGNKLQPMKETDLCQPQTIYGITKLASSLFAKIFAQKNHRPIITLRIFSPYGPFDHDQRLISSTIIKFLTDQSVILNSKQTVRDYIYITDVLDAYIASSHQAKNLSGEIINIGSGKQHTTKDLVDTIVKVGNFEAPVQWTGKSGRNHESMVWQADISKALKILNWHPKFDLDRGLTETIKWFKTNV